VVQETLQEIALMRRLTHPNLLQLIGASTEPEVCILSEICDMGSIFDYYYHKLFPRHQRFDEATARRLALESAKGLAFMHAMQPAFMHRDIKSLNVFLSNQMTAKVADFGMATSQAVCTDGGGTIQWMAPEVLQCWQQKPTPYDLKVDVWAFGILVWELFHCRAPYR
jgi:serine/threonine protein kinase